MPYSRRGAVKGYSTGRASAARQQMAARYNAGARSAARRALFSPAVRKALQKDSGELRGMDTILYEAGPIVSTTTTNDSIHCVNLIETGNGSYNRVGRKAFLKSLRLKGCASHQSARNALDGDCTFSVLRMVVIWDKQPSGTLPVWQDVFGYTNQGGTEYSSTMANLRFDNTGRFSILKDVILQAPPLEPGAEDNATIVQLVPYDIFINLKNKLSIFSGDSDPCTIADVSSGALYVAYRQVLYSSTSSPTDKWELSNAANTARLRFTC